MFVGGLTACSVMNSTGFLAGEYGQSGDPDAFAAMLREVLTANA